MLRLKTVTPDSWLIINQKGNRPVGILSKKADGKIFMLLNKEPFTFNDKAELEEAVGFDLFHTIQRTGKITRATQNYINGLPVAYKTIYPIMNHPSGLPTFSKNPHSEVVYCAGYYCLRRNSGWVHSYCSKLDTLEKYDFVGPFKTLEECDDSLQKLRQEEPIKDYKKNDK